MTEESADGLTVKERHLALIERLEREVEEGLAARDIARDGGETGDGHHHPAEAATDADQRERDLSDRLRWERRRESLERARAAIEADTYGICSECGEIIPEGRLRIRPDAEQCVPCSEKRRR
ncbi:MAG: TraR/DksA C4-type zinc finger protein [Thermoleophilia bacterium]|nr:TraR/DksA C4-type zinc finger protein [Thermoleophilia bacterium]